MGIILYEYQIRIIYRASTEYESQLTAQIMLEKPPAVFKLNITRYVQHVVNFIVRCDAIKNIHEVISDPRPRQLL